MLEHFLNSIASVSMGSIRASALQAKCCRERELADDTMILHYFSTRGTIDTVDETMVLHYTPVFAWIL